MWQQFRFSAPVSFLTLAIALTCFYMSTWQFDRYEEKKEFFARLKDPGDARPFQVTESPEFGAKLLVQGQFLFDHEFLLMNRSYQSQPGAKLITPLLLPGSASAATNNAGTLLLIDRGWIPLTEIESGAERKYASTQTEAELIGLVRLSKDAKSFLSPPENMGPESDGRIRRWFRMNVSGISGQLTDFAVLPFYLEMVHQTQPANALTPTSLSGDVLPPGRHLNYTMQWISFGCFALLVGILWQFRARPRLRPAPSA